MCFFFFKSNYPKVCGQPIGSRAKMYAGQAMCFSLRNVCEAGLMQARPKRAGLARIAIPIHHHPNAPD